MELFDGHSCACRAEQYLERDWKSRATVNLRFGSATILRLGLPVLDIGGKAMRKISNELGL